MATKWSLSKKKKTFETLKIPHGGHNKVVSTLEWQGPPGGLDPKLPRELPRTPSGHHVVSTLDYEGPHDGQHKKIKWTSDFFQH